MLCFIEPVFPPRHINNETKWKRYGVTIAGGNSDGNQLNKPRGIYIDDDNQTIYIAVNENHHIVEWKLDAKIGHVVVGNNGQGHTINQLSYPTGVIVDKKNDSLIICDYMNRRVVRWASSKW